MSPERMPSSKASLWVPSTSSVRSTHRLTQGNSERGVVIYQGCRDGQDQDARHMPHFIDPTS